MLTAELSLHDVFESLCELLARFIDASVVFVGLRRNDGSAYVEYLHDHGEIRRQPNITLTAESTSGVVMRTGEPVIGGHPGEWVLDKRIPLNKDRPHTDDTVSAIFVPLAISGEVLGVLSVQSPRADAYVRDDLELLSAVGRYLAIAAHNQRLFQLLRRSAENDPLTGLASQSRVLASVDDGLRRSTDHGSLGIVLADVVNFGLFNDTFGSEDGDRALRMIGERLGPLASERTTIGRYGAAQFMAVIERTAQDEVMETVVAIERALRDLHVRKYGATVPITIGCGYVVAPFDGTSRPTLLSLASMRARISVQNGGRAYGGHEEVGHRFYGDFEGIEAIVESALAGDPYTRLHLIHVNNLAETWGLHLGYDEPERELFRQAAFLHDIGKLLVPDRILMKPARLTPTEFEIMKQHVMLGQNVLAPHKKFAEVARVVGQHHERFDGSGYPHGLQGATIDPHARALSIIDAFSAMTIDRPYHRAISEHAAVAELERCSGRQFDPDYVESFMALRRGAAVYGTTVSKAG